MTSRSIPSTCQDCALKVQYEALLKDEELCDVRLQGLSGDGEVPAIKAILAYRSQVFRRMFFGEFSERSKAQVKLGYDLTTLRALVEFCFTNDITVLHKLKKGVLARAYLRLAAAAHYFDILDLEDKVCQNLWALMEKSPDVACVVLEETCIAETTSVNLSDYAIRIISSRPEKALLAGEGKGVLSLGHKAIACALFDEKTKHTTSEMFKFRCLQLWSEVPSSIDASTQDSSAETEIINWLNEPDANRLEVSRNLALKLDLSLIPPSTISTILEDSPLIHPDEVNKAYKLHALCAEDGCSMFTEDGVLVRGCGRSEVNGRYSRDGEHGDVGKYTKPGFWKGKQVTFTLFRYMPNAWYFSVAPVGKKLGTRADIDFYIARTKEPSQWPPREGWSVVKNGELPPPKVFMTQPNFEL